MDREKIRSGLTENGIPYREDLPDRLLVYYDLLQEWNRRMDLTNVTSEEETVDRHFVDSLSVLKTGLMTENASAIDVGTGAGFPGMVLAIACPGLRITLLDSQQKRLTFLEKVGRETDTKNISIVHLRAEDGARRTDLREQFDYAVARALAPTNVLCEYLLPYVRVNGYALCWKGPAVREEKETGRRAARLLGGRMEMPVPYTVKGREWEHLILPVRKVQHTSPVYPRKAGTPKSKPLGL